MGNARNLADLLGTSTKANQVISTSGAITTTGAFTSVGIDDNADATAITINSSENVGIKTTSPLSALHIKDNDGIMLEDDGTTNTSKMQTLNAGGLRFYTGDTSSQTSRMTIETDGDVNITDGNLVLDSGHGIDFSDTADGTSVGSELLDDYEEGTWTPVINGMTSISYAIQLGKYTKVGNKVTVHVYLRFTATASGNMYISGLPFNTANEVVNDAPHVGVGYQNCEGSVTINGFFNVNNNRISMVESDNVSVDWACPSVTNAYLFMTGTYFA